MPWPSPSRGSRWKGLPSAKKLPPNPLAFAFQRLSHRAYSVAEMRRALEKKFGSSDAVQNAIARLRELGYLDDKKFAASYAASLAQDRAYGRHRLRRELKARLVDYQVIEPALDQAYEAGEERQVLERALDKKVRTIKLPVTTARLYALCQSLMRRGFRYDDIMKAVRARPELKPVSDEILNSEL
jgi:regulatory protein